jgi:plasmid stability protein
MEHEVPEALRAGRRTRRPLPPDGLPELLESTADERIACRLAELDRFTGRVDVPVPPVPEGNPPRAGRPLAPSPGATRGKITPVRRAWVAKYDPTRVDRDPSMDHTDVFAEFSWNDPALALNEPWLHSWLMRGGDQIHSMDIGDLVFPTRTSWRRTDVGWLARRTVVGVWWVDAVAIGPTSVNGKRIWDSIGTCFPLRRFDFPVPVNATRDIDQAFDIAAFRDRSRKALLELDGPDALAVVRACGLPAEVLTEPDPDHLAPLIAALDLGPPTVVRKRILDGVRASAHKRSVESAARAVAVRGLRQTGRAVVSTESKRGIGSDLWARGVEPSGTYDIRVEVKGLSGADPWQARLTSSERNAAVTDAGRGEWWLLIVTRALRNDAKSHWLRSDEAADVFTVTDGGGIFSADRAAAARLRRG